MKYKSKKKVNNNTDKHTQQIWKTWGTNTHTIKHRIQRSI